jgi:hypothetical protein
VLDHDFPSPSLPKSIPYYGIYDCKNNHGHVVVGSDHDTSEFAVNSIFGWWKKHGHKLYPNADKLYIIADSGGSNGYRLKLWKFNLSELATKINIPIHVSHLPPGTSKWNKVEHRLFAFISTNWKGQPLTDFETVVNLISNTKTASGLKVTCTLDHRKYDLGKQISQDQLVSINIKEKKFHGE